MIQHDFNMMASSGIEEGVNKIIFRFSFKFLFFIVFCSAPFQIESLSVAPENPKSYLTGAISGQPGWVIGLGFRV